MLLKHIFLKEMDMYVGGGNDKHYVVKHPQDEKTLTVVDKKGKLVPTVNAKSLKDLVKKDKETLKRKDKKKLD